jgi:hypothetical protein
MWLIEVMELIKEKAVLVLSSEFQVSSFEFRVLGYRDGVTLTAYSFQLFSVFAFGCFCVQREACSCICFKRSAVFHVSRLPFHVSR